jgi:hypothetical protein
MSTENFRDVLQRIISMKFNLYPVLKIIDAIDNIRKVSRRATV